ncbi:MAG: HD domain-containing phosphohydrolase [Gemmatimonadales bacterium]
MSPERNPSDGALRAAELLHDARQHERAGRVPAAMDCYIAAIAEAAWSGAWAAQAAALRRLGVLHHHRNEPAAARETCRTSYDVALRAGDSVLAAEALNALGGFELECGNLATARDTYGQALALGGENDELRARIEQNLGILANVHGDLTGALEHYRQSLEAYQGSGNEHGCAIAFHNLGMVSADRGDLVEADGFFRQSLTIARAQGDVHLEGLCLLNHAEVLIVQQQYVDAQRNADGALGIFDRIGAQLDKADAYRVIGTVYRETGRLALAEARLRAAIDLALQTGSVLSEAEASRELALLYQAMGRNRDALGLLNTAHRLFQRLDARVDLVDVSGRVARLEDTYLALVRDWGQSIESSDSYTFGHSERVAGYAVELARALGLDDHQLAAVRVGAYLHDVGKIQVPHEILTKPGRLTPDEFDVIRMHPVWGVELLNDVEFPWDIKPIIRWHHEKYDGSGYPDRLRGDQIPLGAQIIGIVDVYDALTTTRSYRPAMSHEQALVEMEQCRRWWQPDVYATFVASVGAVAARTPAPASRAVAA